MAMNLSNLGEHELFKQLAERMPSYNAKCLGLVACNGDMLYMWNSVNYCLEAIRIKNTIRDEDYTSIIVFNPNPILLFTVEKLVLNRSATLIGMCGVSGVAVLQLPSRIKDFNSRIDVPCVNLGQRDFLNEDHKVRQCRWHPSSPLDSHFIVLTSDECLRLYNALTGSVLWTCNLSYHSIKRNLPNLRALGETPVDFEFTLPEPHRDKDETKWPILVLWGTGEVYTVTAKLQEESNKIPLMGPLRMYPEAEDNYGGDASSILVLNTTPPIVILATCSGTIYHCLLLPKESDKNDSSKASLHVVECVELELGLVLGAEPNEDISCPIRLESDPIEKSRYLCIHRAGVHGITLPLVAKLQEFVNKDKSEFEPYQSGCIAEYILCTSLVSDSRISNCPILGLTHLDLDYYLVILSNWRAVILQLPSYLAHSALTFSSERDSGEDGFVMLVQTMMKAGSASKPPLLKLPPDSTQPKEWLELALKIMQQYRSGVFKNYEAAAVKIQQQVGMLKLGMANQRRMIERLNVEKLELQNSAEQIAERYEEINEKQSELMNRTEQLLLKLRTHGGILNGAEKKLTTIMNNSSVRADQLVKEIQRIRAAANYQQNSENKQQAALKESNNFLTENKRKLIRYHLEKLNFEIAELTKRVKELQKLCNY